MRVAIVGTGIAGLTVAHHLQHRHQLVLFEANDYAGGHTHTVDVQDATGTLAVDTGFIVFNDWTYPHFIELLTGLGVPAQPTDMSFSVRCEASGLEYNGTSLNTLFAQRRNLFRPAFLGMIRDILRFNRESTRLLEDADARLTLDECLQAGGYGAAFRDEYIVPMGAAIWSAAAGETLRMPARFFVEFFRNHGMLSVNRRPQWQVVAGGSRRYVRALLGGLRGDVRLNCPVRSVRRGRAQVEVASPAGVECFDRVVMACHSDQALALLADPSPVESELLGAIGYVHNDVVLHTDASVMPRRRLAWASWNYHKPREATDRVTVTYWMNALQSLRASREYFVTLNRSEDIDPDKVLRRFDYAHPCFSRAAVAAQARRADISARQRTHYCGAYWRYGFHEDGVMSGLDVVRELADA